MRSCELPRVAAPPAYPRPLSRKGRGVKSKRVGSGSQAMLSDLRLGNKKSGLRNCFRRPLSYQSVFPIGLFDFNFAGPDRSRSERPTKSKTSPVPTLGRCDRRNLTSQAGRTCWKGSWAELGSADPEGAKGSRPSSLPEEPGQEPGPAPEPWSAPESGRGPSADPSGPTHSRSHSQPGQCSSACSNRRRRRSRTDAGPSPRGDGRYDRSPPKRRSGPQ
jgi:hypothetical protein